MVYRVQVNPILSMASVFVGMLCTFIAYIYLVFTAPAYNITGSITPVIMAFAFLVGLQIYNIFLVPVKVRPLLVNDLSNEDQRFHGQELVWCSDNLYRHGTQSRDSHARLPRAIPQSAGGIPTSFSDD